MADETTTTETTETTETTGPAATPAKADPNAAVLDAIATLRQALVDSGMDETTVDAKLSAVVPNQPSVVGNFADLQRFGAAQAAATEEGSDG